MANLLILFKVALNSNKEFGPIFNLVNRYANIYPYAKSYFVVCKPDLHEMIKLEDNLIYVKLKENNYESLLIKVLRSIEFFKNDILDKYTHIVVSNISTFINIPILYNRINNNLHSDCLSFIGRYNFSNITYDFASGACYIFSKKLTLDILNDFMTNNYITTQNELSLEFKNTHPTTDDIAFGLLMYKKNIKIIQIDRYEYSSKPKKIENLSYSHYRIKTFNLETDYDIHIELFKKIYPSLEQPKPEQPKH